MYLLLAGCTPTPPVSADPDLCDASFEAGMVEVLANGFDDPLGTEGLSFGPDGTLYVGGVGADSSVWTVDPNGGVTELAAVPQAVGLAWWNDALLVAVGDTGDGEPGLVAVTASGQVTPFATGMPGANFAAVTPWDTVLLSSPSGSTLWEVLEDGSWSVWAEDVPSPNGIGFSPAGDRVYVANTYLTPSTVSVIEVQDGGAGAVQVLATLPDGSTQDGVALDAEGNLYVLNNLPGTIARITPEGQVSTVADGVEYGASMAFGQGAFDPCSLYVTSLFSDVVFRVGTGTTGLDLYR